jgi:alkylation response protein AidB-like acyl-CoA dehydrogenase
VNTNVSDLSVDEFLDEARRFLDRYPPRPPGRARFEWGVGDDRVQIFRETTREEELEELAEVKVWRGALADAGLSWITGPAELGGRGLSRRHQAAFDTVLAEYAVPSSSMLTVSLGMVAPTITIHGTDSARKRYLAAMYSAEIVACQLFSEPGAGSDLASVSTRAVRDGDGWRVTGQKVWTSGAHVSDIGEILCRTSDGPRHADLTMFVVDMHAPGVEVRPLRQMTGGASFNEVFFDDVLIPDDDRLGGVGEGWKVALTTLMHERGAIGGPGLGGTGIFDFDRIRQVIAHRGMGDDPATHQMLARLFTGVRTAGWTRRRAAARLRAGAAPGPEQSILKLVLVRNLLTLSELLTHVLGPALIADSGEWGTYGWADYVLGVPGLRIGGGTDEVLRNIVGERVLGLPKEPTAKE